MAVLLLVLILIGLLLSEVGQATLALAFVRAIETLGLDAVEIE